MEDWYAVQCAKVRLRGRPIRPAGHLAALLRRQAGHRVRTEQQVRESKQRTPAAGQKLSEFGIRAVTRQHRSTEHTVPNRRTDRPAFLGPSDRQLGALAVGCWALLVCFWLLRFSRSPPMPGVRTIERTRRLKATTRDKNTVCVPHNLLLWKWTFFHAPPTRFHTRVSFEVEILSPDCVTRTYAMSAWSGPSMRTWGETMTF